MANQLETLYPLGVAKSLKKCSSQDWVFNKLLLWIDNPQFVQKWAADFKNIEQRTKHSVKQLDASAIFKIKDQEPWLFVAVQSLTEPLN